MRTKDRVRYILISMVFIFMDPCISNSKDMQITDNNYFSVSSSYSKCIYNNGSNIPIVITIKNVTLKDVYIPLEYIKKTGPAIELIDVRNDKSMPLKPNLASWDLKDKMTYIPPNESVSFQWTILDAEVKPFVIDGMVNVSAKISVVTKVYDNQKNDVGTFISSSNITIIGNGLDETKH